MNTPKLHTVCVVGAPADVSARIHALLDEQRTRLDARWRIGDYVGAELLLIETDSVYGHMDWLKAQGKGYQVRMNAILRREMIASLRSRRDER